MAGLPGIIIRTAKEREAERQAEENFPLGLSEGRLPSGQVLIYIDRDIIPRDDYTEFKIWRFKTEESRLVFAAARVLELQREGVHDIGAPYARICGELSDRRLTPDSYDNPNRIRIRSKECAPLIW